MLNNWELIGNFMYTPADYLALVSLARAGLLPLETVDVREFGFEDLETAIDHAGVMDGAASTVIKFT